MALRDVIVLVRRDADAMKVFSNIEYTVSATFKEASWFRRKLEKAFSTQQLTCPWVGPQYIMYENILPLVYDY